MMRHPISSAGLHTGAQAHITAQHACMHARAHTTHHITEREERRERTLINIFKTNSKIKSDYASSLQRSAIPIYICSPM